MIPHIKKFFLIVVHHGDPGPTNHFLETISGSSGVLERIFLIDQAEVPYLVPAHTGPITVIRPHLNAGYAAGINIGLGAIYSAGANPADVIICANNDITLETAALKKIQAWWVQHGEGHILGARFGSINLLTGRSQLTAQSNSQPLRPWEIRYLDGALFSLSVGTFFDLSGMRSEYMLYWEDAAFSQKAARRGVKLHSLELPLHHPSDTAPHQTDAKLYYLVRNGAHFLAHETTLPWRLFWQLKNRARLIYHHFHPDHTVIRAALAAALKNQLGPRV